MKRNEQKERVDGAVNPNPELLVYVSAGEASGDAYAARLIQSLRGQWDDSGDPELVFGGLAGSKTASLGVNLIENSSQWGAIGILHAASVYLRVRSGALRTMAEISSKPPGLFIPIDFGYANVKIARTAKKAGWQVLYFVPPGSWRRDRQGRDLPYVTDAIVTPFEWSATMLKKSGANVFWFGHPIKQLIAEERLRISNHCQRSANLLAILPGSRAHEIDANLPLIAKSIKGLNVPVEFAVASSLDADEFKKKWESLSSHETTYIIGQSANLLLRARAAIVCSGTATLEAALCDCPMVVIYEIPKAARVEVRLRFLKAPKFISLPNIMLDRAAVPEYLGLKPIPPEIIQREIEALLADGPVRDKQLAAFADLNELLGPSDAIDRTAQLAKEMLKKLAKP